MKDGEIKEILDKFPDIDIDNFLELGTACPICCCYEQVGHSDACFKYTETKLQDFKGIFSHMHSNIGKNHEDTFGMIPTILKKIDAPIFFFLNVEKFGSKIGTDFLPIRPIHEELRIILKNHNHSGIFCFTEFQSWPKYPSWTETLSRDVILKIIQKDGRKIVDHFEKNGHYIIVTTSPEPESFPPISSPEPESFLPSLPTFRLLLYTVIILGIFVGASQFTTN